MPGAARRQGRSPADQGAARSRAGAQRGADPGVVPLPPGSRLKRTPVDSPRNASAPFFAHASSFGGKAMRAGGPMRDKQNHPYIRTLFNQLAERRIDRREFLRTSTLLGLSATTAYAAVDRVFGDTAAWLSLRPSPGAGPCALAWPARI